MGTNTYCSQDNYTDITYAAALAAQSTGTFDPGKYRITDWASAATGTRILYIYLETYRDYAGRTLLNETGFADMYNYDSTAVLRTNVVIKLSTGVLIQIELAKDYDQKITQKPTSVLDLSTIIRWGSSVDTGLEMVEPVITYGAFTGCSVSNMKGSFADTITFTANNQGIDSINAGSSRIFTFSGTSSLTFSYARISSSFIITNAASFKSNTLGGINTYEYTAIDADISGGNFLTIPDSSGTIHINTSGGPYTITQISSTPGNIGGELLYIDVSSAGQNTTFADNNAAGGTRLPANTTLRPNKPDYIIFQYNSTTGFWVQIASEIIG